MKPVKIPCYCGSIRQASRIVTQMYDRALKPSGLKITQFGILRLLSARPGLTTGEIAEMLAMDSTTLTRTLKIIQEGGWIAVSRGDDRRERHWHVTAAGQERLQQALPMWKDAQQAFADMMQDVDMDTLTRTVFQLAQRAAQQAPAAD
ncbi:MAG TPA: MarR family transcriptional regulator [Noviherbaspirillum sp.]|uniref:MarR family winged helix-turn-helix transcriptional regulator n=1 Tax=Noviherbaspirillum sp. TaxID=1926288 RepID=UPI002F95A0CC